MKVLLAAFLISTVSAAPTTEIPPGACPTNMKSRYQFVSDMQMVIIPTNNGYTGMYMDVNFTVGFCPYVVEIETCNVFSYPVVPNESIPPHPICDELVKERLYFRFENGRVTELYPRIGMKDNILNIFRGILSSFQVKPIGYDDQRDRTETDIFGECPTKIREVHVNDKMIITKKRDLTKCSLKPQFTVMPQYEFYDQANVLTSFASMQYTMSRIQKSFWPVVRKIHIEHSVNLSPMTPRYGSILSYVNQTVLFLEDFSAPTTKKPIDTETKDLLFSYDIVSEKKTLDCVKESDIVLKEVSTVPTVEKWKIPMYFRRLTEILKKCEKTDLITLVEKYSICKNDKTVSTQMRFRHAFLLDALAFTWTDSSFETIVELVKGKCLGDSRKREMMVAMSLMPVHSIKTCNPIQYAMEIFDATPTAQTSSLVLGSIVGTFRKTKRWNRECNVVLTEAKDKLVTKWTMYFNQIPAAFKRNTKPRTDVNSWERAIHSLKAIANMGDPTTLPIFKTAIKSTKLDVEGRIIAVETLEKFLPVLTTDVRRMLVDIFADFTIEDEIRSVTVPIYVASLHPRYPGITDELYDFFGSLMTLNRPAVKSFACTYLMEVIRSSDPTLLDTAAIIKNIMSFYGGTWSCLIADHGYFSSKAWRGFLSVADLPILPYNTVPRDTMGIGMDSHFYSDFDTKVPHGLTTKFKFLIMGYEIDLGKFGIRGSGLDTLITTLFSPTGYFRRGTRNMSPSGLQREENFLFDLVRPNMSISSWVELLGSDLAWNHNEEDDVTRKLFGPTTLNALRGAWTHGLLNRDFDFYSLTHMAEAWHDSNKKEEGWMEMLYRRAEEWWSRPEEPVRPVEETDTGVVKSVMSTASKLWRYGTKGDWPVDSRNIDISKNLEVLNIKYVYPTIAGLPFVTTMRADVHFGLKAESNLTYHADGYFWNKDRKDNFIMDGYLSPRMVFSMLHNVTIDDEFFRPTICQHGNSTFDFAQRGRAILNDDFTFTWELEEVPETEVELLKFQYDQFVTTKNPEFRQQIGIKKRSNTELYKPVFDELLGLGVFSHMSFPNTTGVDLAPAFPFSGPAYFNLTIKRMDPRIKRIRVELFNESLISWTNGFFTERYMTVDKDGLPIKQVWIESFWDTTKDDKTTLNVALTSESLNGSAWFIRDRSKFLSIEGSGFVYTNISNLTLYTKFNSSSLRGVIERKRFAEDKYPAFFKFPEFKFDFNGSLVNNTYGNFSARLFKEGWPRPHWLKMNSTTLRFFVNTDVKSSLVSRPLNFGMVLPLPLRKPMCHVVGDHFITFDDKKYITSLGDNCEYVLARDRHLNDTFAVTIKNTIMNNIKNKELIVYVNDTMYTLTMDGTQFKIFDREVMLPYKEKHVIHVRKVAMNNDIYVRMTLWAGIDVYYSRDDVLLYVNGFYMNRLAGLCGNGNYNDKDDWQLQDMEITKDLKVFVNDWRINCPIHEELFVCDSYLADAVLTPPTMYDPCNGEEICKRFFEDKFANVSYLYPVTHYYDVCRRDVACGLSPLPSVRAYMKAARAKELWTEDGCVYGPYGPWEECHRSEQRREREVLCNPLGHVCGETVERRPCPSVSVDEGCVLKKEHLLVVSGKKLCKSRRKLPVCKKALDKPGDCKPVYEEMAELDEYYCISSGESLDKLDNVSPIKIQYNKVRACRYSDPTPTPP
ncbi:uncharacterized protein [Oscarella lobularis]|uniref:uncharacterized protein n=1 Tax=Oscarella lobularis TaxID=121494 RepID=UPI003313A2CD